MDDDPAGGGLAPPGPPAHGLTAVEPFVGAGGMAEGLRRAGFRSLWAGDMEPRSVATAKAAGLPAEVVRLDVSEAIRVAMRLPDDVDVVAGGCPCQPFSTAGRMEGEWDPRDGFPAMLSLVREVRPRAVLIENVKGLTSRAHLPYLERIGAALKALGYAVPCCPDQGWPGRVHDAADYGLPQRRQRILIVGLLDRATARRFRWPEPTHHQSGLVWAKWGPAGEGRGGVVGGSYWTEHGLAGPSDALMTSQPSEALQMAGLRPLCSQDAPSPTVRGHSTQHALLSESRSGTLRIDYPRAAMPAYARGPSDGLRRHPVSAEDLPAVAQTRCTPAYLGALGGPPRPSKEEARILKAILAGKVEVRGPRWRTVRDAIGGSLLATERRDRDVDVDGPSPAIGGSRPGGGGASLLLLAPGPGQGALPQSRRAEDPDRPCSSVQAGGESHHGPQILGVVGDGPAAKIAARPIRSLDEPSVTVRGGSPLKGGAGAGVLLAVTADHPGAERAVDMATGTPTALHLRPFFTFYGGKWRCAPRYPPPRHRTIVEPFAGSAGYSLRHAHRQVILVERDPAIAATWRYLLHETPAGILALPDIRMDETVDDLPVCEEARLLIGWWLNNGSSLPKRRPSAWMRRDRAQGGPGWTTGGGRLAWGRRVRERIAAQLGAVRHWTLIEGDYTDAPDVEATWFVDPPYSVAGRHYRYGSARLDYGALADWCRSRQGQAMVCENVGADWLPFQPFLDVQARGAGHDGRVSHEALWVLDAPVRVALVRNTAIHRGPEILDPDAPAKAIRDEGRDQFMTEAQIGLLGIANRRGRPLGIRVSAGTDLAVEGSAYVVRAEVRSADEPAPALRGSAGGSSQPFAVIGAGSWPHGPDRPEERRPRDVTDEPGPAMTAEQIGNHGPWIAEGRHVCPADGSHGTAGTEPGRLDEPCATVTAAEERGTRASAASGWDFHGGPDRAADTAFRAVGLRRLTPQECAALQGFPADWPFVGPKTAVYRQVGNACPPALAEAIGRSLSDALASAPRRGPARRKARQIPLFGLV